MLAENVFSEGTTNLRLTSGDLSVGVIHTVGNMNINVDSGDLTDASDDDTSTRDADIRSTGDINITVWGGLGTSTSRVDVFTEYDDQDTEDTSDDVYGTLSVNVRDDVYISAVGGDLYVKNMVSGQGMNDGNIDIRAYNSVLDADPLANDDDEYGGNEDIRAHGIKIVADASIGTLTNVLEIDSMDDDIAVVLKAGDSVVVSEDSGDLNIGEITAGTTAGNVVSLYAQNNIFDRRNTGITYAVQANALRMFTGTGDIGELGADGILDAITTGIQQPANADTPIIVDVNYFEEMVAAGKVVIRNDGLVTVGDSANEREIRSTDDINIITNSPMTVDGVIASDTDVVLQASEDASDTADILLLTANAQVSGADVTLRAGDQIDIRDGATVTSTGDMTLRADYQENIDSGYGTVDIAGQLTVGGDLAFRAGETANDSVVMTGAVVNVTGDTEFTNGPIDLNDTQLTTNGFNGTIQSEFDVDADTNLTVNAGFALTTSGAGDTHEIGGVIDVAGSMGFTDESGTDDILLMR